MSSQFLGNAGGLKTVIFAVLSDLLQRHPALGISIAGETTANPSWVRLDKIDLEEVVRFQEMNESYKFVEDMHQLPFDRMGELPLWRAIVVGRHPTELPSSIDPNKDQRGLEEYVFEIGFFYHHGIGDGTSGAAFHMDFLDTMNSLADTGRVVNIPIETVVKPPELDLLPSIEGTRAWPLSMKFVAGEVLKEYVLPDNHSLWTGPPVQFPPAGLPKTRLLTLFFDRGTVARLTQLCRRNSVTMTPLLSVVIARLLASRHSNRGDLTATVAISLRRFSGVDNRQVVNHVASVTVPFSTFPKSGSLSSSGSNPLDWSVVRSCKKFIDATAMSPANQNTALLRFLNDYRGWFKKRIGKRREASFEVSNIGVIDGGMENSGTARFRRIIFSQSASVPGPPYCFSIATTKGGDMAIALSWQDGILEDGARREVLAALEAEILKLADLDES